MEPLTMIATAKALLSVTGLDDKIGDWIDDKTGGAASKVVEIAEAVVPGISNPGVTVTTAEAASVQKALLDRESEIRRLAHEDRERASRMYVATNGSREITNEVIRHVFKFNPWLILILAACNGLVLYFVKDTTIAVAAGNLLGASITQLWQERRTAIEFLMGAGVNSPQESK